MTRRKTKADRERELREAGARDFRDRLLALTDESWMTPEILRTTATLLPLTVD